MPIQDWNQQTTFDAAYNVGIGLKLPHWAAEPRLNYSRVLLYQQGERLAVVYRDLLSITSADTVVVVGGGFGWSAEALELLTGCDAISVDTSSWIGSVKDGTEDVEIASALDAAGVPAGEHADLIADLHGRARGPGVRARVPVSAEDLSNNGSRNRVRGLFASGRITVGITEDMLSTMTDGEIGTALSNLGALDAFRAVAHLVTTSEIGGVASGYNWKTLAEWRSFLDGLGATGDILIEHGTYRTA